MHSEAQHRAKQPAFVFAMAAAAVGLGNLWRFLYMVGAGSQLAFNTLPRVVDGKAGGAFALGRVWG